MDLNISQEYFIQKQIFVMTESMYKEQNKFITVCLLHFQENSNKLSVVVAVREWADDSAQQPQKAAA